MPCVRGPSGNFAVGYETESSRCKMVAVGFGPFESPWSCALATVGVQLRREEVKQLIIPVFFCSLQKVFSPVLSFLSCSGVGPKGVMRALENQYDLTTHGCNQLLDFIQYQFGI